MNEIKKDPRLKDNPVFDKPEYLLAKKRLDKPSLSDPIVISRLFKRITNKTLDKFRPDKRRVITRPFRPGREEHARNVIDRALKLDDRRVRSLLEEIISDFDHRHKDISEILLKNYRRIEGLVPDAASLSDERKMLLGSCFTMEYSMESTALFNPSIVVYPKQNDLKKGQTRVLFSFRATGEGHISSIAFRSAVIDRDNSVFMEPISRFVSTPEMVPHQAYDRDLFRSKLEELGFCSEAANAIFSGLPEKLTIHQIRAAGEEVRNRGIFLPADMDAAMSHINWLAESNYEVFFTSETLISERVIFPLSQNESNGVEDARFVKFVDDDRSETYYATCCGYNGREIMSQLLETKDFHHFKMITLNGPLARNKGMALFPRKINGLYAMISRMDGESLYLSYSNNIHFWFEGEKIESPEQPWEIIQIGNCGSPIETKEGWILLTHGVGPMRKYCIGAVLLDLNDPTKVIGRLKEPLISPREEDREGYVPNVVYSCGAEILNGDLVIPYAISDSESHIAMISVQELIDKLKKS